MPKTVIQKITRGASPVLLVLAALCFLLPFVGVSCNTSAGQAALGGAINSFGGSNGGGGASSSQAATDCLNALNGKDLATYSGVNLLTGSDPTTVTDVPGCQTSSTSTSPSSSGLSGIGTQVLLVAAAVLIFVGILATPLRGALRGFIAGGAALAAGVLVVVNNSSTHDAIIKKITTSGSGSSGSLSSLGVTGGLDSFFNIHVALGFILILAALGLAFLVNLLAIATAGGGTATPVVAGGGPYGGDPGFGGGAPPPSAPPPTYTAPPAPS